MKISEIQYYQVCTCGHRCPIHDPQPPLTVTIYPPCSGCGSSEVGAHWPNCLLAMAGDRVIVVTQSVQVMP